MITQARAKSLAAAYVRTFAPYLSDGWEKQRGGTLNLGTAEISPRVYLARSNYGAVPVQGFHPAVRRLYGSYFIVTFVDKGLPVLAVAVSAFNNDVTINDRGLLMLPPNGGNQFKPMALPVKRDEYDLSTPEEAAAEVAVATGAKVVEVPELVLQARPKSPLLALWEVKLDRNVAVSGAHGRGSVNALYVGYAKAARFHAADAAQPAIESRRYTRIDSRGRDLGEAGIVIPVRRGEPIRFSPAHISRED